jgi:peptidoglycan/LPS O-acetylase OafA/YrhL
MATSPVTTSRRYDFDWLRVITIVVVFIFHSMRFFDEGGWHVKNGLTYEDVQDWVDLLVLWIMPLMFVISGASIFHALDKGGGWKFIKDKILRLLVPLVVGIFTLSLPQVYLDALTTQRFSGTFWQWLPHYFEGIFPFGGNFAFTGVHLWYLEALFIFCLIFLPLFQWLKGGGSPAGARSAGKPVLEAMGKFLALPGAVYLLALPTILLTIVLDPRTVGMRDTGGWSLIVYIFFFLPGFVLASHEGALARIRQMRWVSLALALATSILYIAQGDVSYGTPEYALFFTSMSLASWFWILALMGLASKYLTFSTPFLKYANEAVLPFYCLHQPVLLGIGWFVVGAALPDEVKWLIIAASSFVTIMAIYELLIRRINVMRVLFGMKALPRGEAMAEVKLQGAK